MISFKTKSHVFIVTLSAYKQTVFKLILKVFCFFFFYINDNIVSRNKLFQNNFMTERFYHSEKLSETQIKTILVVSQG